MAGKTLLAFVFILCASQHLFCVADEEQPATTSSDSSDEQSKPYLCFGRAKPFMDGKEIKQCDKDGDCTTTAETGICINSVCCPKSVRAKGPCANGGYPKKSKPTKDAPIVTCTTGTAQNCGQNFQCETIRTESGDQQACCPKSVALQAGMCGGLNTPLLTKDGSSAIACNSSIHLFNHSCPDTFYCARSHGESYCCPSSVRTRDGFCPKPEFNSTSVCADPCRSDGECQSDRLCCASHCGLKCSNPVKPGSCPAITGPGICVQECNKDSECTDDKKCCYNGCGRLCRVPVVECKSTEFKCKASASSDKCVPMSAKCDGVKDCYDEKDEMDCKKCSIGEPLPGVSCGRGTPCKVGYTCKVHPTDKWGICCKEEKKEFCPLVKQGQASTCEIRCKSNEDCDDEKICCKNECGGAVCKTPVDEAPQKEGLCPMVNSRNESSCDKKQHCTIDTDCSGDAKCCRDGCGMVCKKPVKDCGKDFREKMISLQKQPDKCTKISIPRCDKTGHYSSMQCEDSTGKCWCVTENNEKIADTEVFGFPDCTAVTKPGLCPKVDKNVYVRCGGYACLNDKGCSGETPKCCYYDCGLKEPPMSSCQKPRAKQQDQGCPNGRQPKCCMFNGCVGAVCPADPGAVCRVDPCNDCKPTFFRRHGIEVNCTKDLSDCQRQAYKAASDIVSEMNYTTKLLLYLRKVHLEGLDAQRLIFEEQRMPDTPGPVTAITNSGRTTPKPMSDSHNDDDDHDKDDDDQEKKVYDDDDDDEDKDPWKEICKLPPKIGKCKAAFPRYYFDPTTGKCEKFTYGGCDGNQNNFKTLKECEKACLEEQSRCRAPPYVGMCKAAIKSWFYNFTSGQCETFYYGGCGATSKSNKFSTKLACLANCSYIDLCKDKQCPAGQKCAPTDHNTAKCFPTSEIGHMGKHIPECEKDGSYSPVQCDISQHVCWCVDKKGKPVNGTMTVKGKPDCSGTKPPSVVCPNKKVEPIVCNASNCQKANCGKRQDVACKQDPCDNCKVHFVDKTDQKVECEEEENTCKRQPPVIKKNPKFECVNSVLKWYYSESKKACVAFNFSKGCFGEDIYFTSKESCQDTCLGSACPGKADQPQCSDPCSGKSCPNQKNTASCVVNRCTCEATFKNDYSNKEVNCEKLSTICQKHRAKAIRENNKIKANNENTKEVFVPQCTDDGAFSPVQCDTTECWCVNPAGKVMEKSKKPVAEKENMKCVKQIISAVTLTFRMNGDYSKVVKGKEAEFKRQCLKGLKKLGEKAFKDVKDVRPREGSIIVEIDFEAADESSDVLASASFMEDEIIQNGVLMEIDGVELTVDENASSMSLVVKEEEGTTKSPTDDEHEGKDSTTIILAAVCGTLAAIVIVGAIVFVIHKKRSSDGGSEVYFSNLENEKGSGIQGYDNHIYQ